MEKVKPTYLRPWSAVDDEELRLLRELLGVCRDAFQPPGCRMLHTGVPDRLHAILDALKRS